MTVLLHRLFGVDTTVWAGIDDAIVILKRFTIVKVGIVLDMNSTWSGYISSLIVRNASNKASNNRNCHANDYQYNHQLDQSKTLILFHHFIHSKWVEGKVGFEPTNGGLG